MDERRRYFRIEDTLAVHYERLTEAEAVARRAAIQKGEYGRDNKLQTAERQLQLLIDKLRVQNPDFAEAINLLNIKFNSLKEQGLEPLDRHNRTVRASISACGISFDVDERLLPGEKVYFDITLLPTDLHIHTLAEVVDCIESEDDPRGWRLSADFYGLDNEDEELMVQHIVKRQGRLLGQKQDRT